MPGLRNTIALDFHLSQSALYWTDVVEDKIYRGKLLDNGGDSLGLGEMPGLHTDGIQGHGPRFRWPRSRGFCCPSPAPLLIG